MAQHISVVKTDSSGRVLNESLLNFADILNYILINNVDINHLRILPFIDIYGNTTLNRIQLNEFVKELLIFKQKESDIKLTKSVNDLLEYINTLKTHEYLKLIGD